ncbi:MAG: HRDC domain-containing protein, partial [Desulfocapsaceae bacterium]|nr:HRDC domain-containing protein [Desulfocapsaceae bacterium]
FPLKPAWAITIHKSQGLTFEKAVIDAGAAFTHGQVYVALSRCKTFEGMVLSSPLTALAVKTDATVLRFIEQATNNPPSPAKLACARIRYQQQLLTACFDFQYLRSRLGRLAGLLLNNAQIVHVSGTAAGIRTLERDFIDEVFTVGENFKQQLARLFAAGSLPESDDVILDRLAKASVYFQDKLTALLVPFIKDIRIDTDNKEIQKKAKEALGQLEKETAVKLAAVTSCRTGFSPAEYLRAIAMADIDLKPVREKKRQAATALESDIDHPLLFKSLKDWRAKKAGEAKIAHYQVLHQKTLVQIAVQLPDNLQELAAIKGIGKKLLEKYGAELVALVAAYRREQNSAAPEKGERA